MTDQTFNISSRESGRTEWFQRDCFFPHVFNISKFPPISFLYQFSGRCFTTFYYRSVWISHLFLSAELHCHTSRQKSRPLPLPSTILCPDPRRLPHLPNPSAVVGRGPSSTSIPHRKAHTIVMVYIHMSLRMREGLGSLSPVIPFQKGAWAVTLVFAIFSLQVLPKRNLRKMYPRKSVWLWAQRKSSPNFTSPKQMRSPRGRIVTPLNSLRNHNPNTFFSL